LGILICLFRKHDWNIDHWDSVSAFPECKVEDNDSYSGLPAGCLDGLSAPIIIARVKAALDSLKQALQLLHNINITFLHSVELALSQHSLILYLCSHGILMLWYLSDNSIVNRKQALQLQLISKPGSQTGT
jgi:hypothetical protein